MMMLRSTFVAAALYAAIVLLHTASAFVVPSGTFTGLKSTCVQSSRDDDFEQHSVSSEGMSRRDALTNSGAALASILLGGSALSWPSPAFGADYGTDKRTVLITGMDRL